MAAHPFVIVPSLTAIAISYPQGKLIADEVLPRVPVDSETFRYLKYGKADLLQAPDTTVGRKGAPNQIDWSASEVQASVVDQALDTPVPNADVMAWEQARAANPSNVSVASPDERATLQVMQTVMNRREYRAAQVVFGAGNYNANNKVTLSGTGQWSDYTNSDPISAIMTALDSMVIRPNISAMGRQVATKLRMHPKVCKAVFGNNTDAGVVPLQALADLLELDAIYVGDGWINTAAPGQAANLSRVWGKHASFMVRDRTATTQGGVTFGMTAQYGTRFGGTIEDPDVGARGGKRVRAGESVLELATADDLGYLFTNAVA